MAFLLLTRSGPLASEVHRLLAAEGFTDFLTADLKAVLDSAELPQPDLVLIEVPADADTVLEQARVLRDRLAPAVVPFLALVTGPRTGVSRSLGSCFDDAIVFPDDRDDLSVRVRLAMRQKKRIDELHDSYRHLLELSSRDELTGLYNRRYFFECLALEFERAIRYQQPLSCIMIDLDQFKPINDNFGHLVGDALFKKAAALFRAIPRRVDVVARYGGDEVAVLLPATAHEPAVHVADRLCRTMSDNRFVISGRDIDMTVSVGVATMDPENPISPDELLRRADMAMYAAKHAGRNSVRVWTPELADNKPFSSTDVTTAVDPEVSS